MSEGVLDELNLLCLLRTCVGLAEGSAYQQGREEDADLHGKGARTWCFREGRKGKRDLHLMDSDLWRFCSPEVVMQASVRSNTLHEPM